MGTARGPVATPVATEGAGQAGNQAAGPGSIGRTVEAHAWRRRLVGVRPSPRQRGRLPAQRQAGHTSEPGVESEPAFEHECMGTECQYPGSGPGKPLCPPIADESSPILGVRCDVWDPWLRGMAGQPVRKRRMPLSFPDTGLCAGPFHSKGPARPLPGRTRRALPGRTRLAPSRGSIPALGTGSWWWRHGIPRAAEGIPVEGRIFGVRSTPMDHHEPMPVPPLSADDGSCAPWFLCTCGRSGDGDIAVHLLEVAEVDLLHGKAGAGLEFASAAAGPHR